MELKKTIARSYSRKVNLGNYETSDFWAMYQQEVEAGIDPEALQALSEDLYLQAKRDVEMSTNAMLGVNKSRLQQLYDKVAAGEAIPVEEWQNLSFHEQSLIHKAQLKKNQDQRITNKHHVEKNRETK